MLVCDVT